MPLHYVRRLTVVSLLVCTNTKGSDIMYYNNKNNIPITLFYTFLPLLSFVGMDIKLHYMVFVRARAYYS